VTISGKGQHDSSFSADTGMGECLVTGIKNSEGVNEANFIILYKKPSSKVAASEIARQITILKNNTKLRSIKDGPYGGSSIMLGGEKVGFMSSAEISPGQEFKLNSIRDLSLAQSAYQLEHNSTLWLPSMTESDKISLPMSRLDGIASFGPYHADVSGKNGRKPRGPFILEDSDGNSGDTYPVLWAHDAEVERCIQFEHDKAGLIHAVDDSNFQSLLNSKAANVLATASNCHFNQNFRFNSQSTAFQFTSRLVIGGRAWLSVNLSDDKKEKALTIWGNTSVGLLLHWWHANKQQSGRGNIVKTALVSLPVLDIGKLSPKQLDAADFIFDEFKERPLKPFNEIADDPVRQELDEAFFTRVLGFDIAMFATNGPFNLLRSKFDNEPSIQGSKLK